MWGARRTGERISFHYLISQKYTGDQVRLDVLRDGETLELDVRLASPDALVPLHLGGLGPSFLIMAGAPAMRVPFLWKCTSVLVPVDLWALEPSSCIAAGAPT